MTEINLPLLQKVLDHAEAHPEEVDLSRWAVRGSCGTTACVAGWAALLTGHEIDWVRTLAGHVVYTMTDGRSIKDVARDGLGLDGFQANALFHSPTMTTVWEVAERITNGEIRRNP